MTVLMNGPQQTAVSCKELWQKWKLKGFCHTKISEEYSCDAATDEATDLEHDSAVIGTATYSLIVNFWTPPIFIGGVRKKNHTRGTNCGP